MGACLDKQGWQLNQLYYVTDVIYRCIIVQPYPINSFLRVCSTRSVNRKFLFSYSTIISRLEATQCFVRYFISTGNKGKALQFLLGGPFYENI